MKKIHEFKVIDFETKRQERERQKRYEYIQSMIQINEPELFDKLIAEQELTDEKIASCRQFIDFLNDHGYDPLSIFEEATFMPEEDFYEDNGINWYIAIDEALTYYAVLRKEDKDKYNIALFVHPYISAFE